MRVSISVANGSTPRLIEGKVSLSLLLSGREGVIIAGSCFLAGDVVAEGSSLRGVVWGRDVDGGIGWVEEGVLSVFPVILGKLLIGVEAGEEVG